MVMEQPTPQNGHTVVTSRCGTAACLGTSAPVGQRSTHSPQVWQTDAARGFAPKALMRV
jgi:hypothetical protein